jgi:hypothetical protein
MVGGALIATALLVVAVWTLRPHPDKSIPDAAATGDGLTGAVLPAAVDAGNRIGVDALGW